MINTSFTKMASGKSAFYSSLHSIIQAHGARFWFYFSPFVVSEPLYGGPKKHVCSTNNVRWSRLPWSFCVYFAGALTFRVGTRNIFQQCEVKIFAELIDIYHFRQLYSHLSLSRIRYEWAREQSLAQSVIYFHCTWINDIFTRLLAEIGQLVWRNAPFAVIFRFSLSPSDTWYAQSSWNNWSSTGMKCPAKLDLLLIVYRIQAFVFEVRKCRSVEP